MEKLITIQDLMARLAVSRTQIHNMRKRGELPAPVQLGTVAGKAPRWRAADVDDWIRSRAAAVEPASTDGPAAGA